MNLMGDAMTDYLTWLATHGYATTTIKGRRHHLMALSDFLEERGIIDPAGVTPADIESYQRHLFHHRKSNGMALTFRTQAQRLVPVKGFFSWLTGCGRLPYDPASALVLPRTEHRLPESTLSVDEVESVLSGPDTMTTLGIRDRAIMEVFYSTAIRRMELIALLVSDIDASRGTLFVRQGKGGRDRHVPIGERALHWVRRYNDEVRPHLALSPDCGTLFLTSYGGAYAPDVLSRQITAYMKAGAPTKRGSCHMFRHTAATLMLDGGADVRYVAEMLGHQKLETTMIYTRVSLTKLSAVHTACHPAEATRTASL